MYTVLRFVGGGKGALDELGGSLNNIRPGIFKGLDKVGDRFSVSISANDDWSKHQNDVLDFLKQIQPVLVKMDRQAVALECDIAVEPEDHADFRGAFRTLSFMPDLIKAMVQECIALAVTIYKGDH